MMRQTPTLGYPYHARSPVIKTEAELADTRQRTQRIPGLVDGFYSFAALFLKIQPICLRSWLVFFIFVSSMTQYYKICDLSVNCRKDFRKFFYT